jgi:hypothetical protein
MYTEEQKRKKRIWNAKNKHKAKKYYEDNKILILSKMKAYRDSNQEIIRERKKKYSKTEKAKELHRIRHKKFYQANFNKPKEYQGKYYFNNKDLINAKAKVYYYNNLEKIYLTKKKTRQKRRALDLAYVRLRQANKIKATPKWANLEKIKQIYLNCPSGYHVDHIVPLNNSVVCGLHVESNLQYLTAKENMRKSNKFTV